MECKFAPWRKEVIEGKKEEGCIFCNRKDLEPASDNLVLFRGKESFILLNKYPYNNGHVMIAPYRHTADFRELSAGEFEDLSGNLERAVNTIREAYNPQGFNIGMNLGTVAGAGVADHMHWHVVPRWGGDTNFMPVTGGTKVLHEMLAESFGRLSPLFGR